MDAKMEEQKDLLFTGPTKSSPAAPKVTDGFCGECPLPEKADHLPPKPPDEVLEGRKEAPTFGTGLLCKTGGPGADGMRSRRVARAPGLSADPVPLALSLAVQCPEFDDRSRAPPAT